ncbi:MAG: hypothetical protein LBT20_00295 [Clostridiales bacterium]|nr:hypothetical protein [Clostridiales bacterium]
MKKTFTTDGSAALALPDRMRSIDQFRGLLLFLNALAYMIGGFNAILASIPSVVNGKGEFLLILLKGIPIDDIFLPMFVFIMGLTACGSFKKLQETRGQTYATRKFALKYLTLIGFGSVIMNGLAEFCKSLLIDKKAFDTIKIGDQLGIILFLITIPLFIFWLVTKIIKNKKLKKIAGWAIKIVWILGGIETVVLIAADAGAKIVGGSGLGVWDVFQTIGFGGLLAVPFMGMNKWGKLTAAFALGILLTAFYHYGGFGDFVTPYKYIFNGGLFGGFGFAIAVLLGGYFRDVKDDNRHLLYWISTAVVLAIPIVLVLGFNFVAARRGATPVYAFFAAGLGAAIWGVFNIIEKFFVPKYGFLGIPNYSFLRVWGGSSLLTYALSMIIATLLGEFAKDASLPVAIIAVIVIMIAIYSLNHYLSAKGKHIKI